jgi:hypothetical protein
VALDAIIITLLSGDQFAWDNSRNTANISPDLRNVLKLSLKSQMTLANESDLWPKCLWIIYEAAHENDDDPQTEIESRWF